VHVGHRADVERQHVVLKRFSAAQLDAPSRRIERDGAGNEAFGTGEAAQACKIDTAIVERLMPGDQSRQHARVDRVRPRIHQRDARGGRASVAETPQNLDVAVSAAEQDKLFHERSLPGYCALPDVSF
jgi:hypothetical protein